MFVPVRFKTSVHLAPMDLTSSLEETILRKLQTSLEGICSRHGYIRPGSIEIVKRSIGQFIKQHFNGHVKFEVICRAEVCNPPQNMIVEALVKNKNALGIHAESTIRMGDTDVPVLDIIIPKRSAGIQSEIDLEDINIGENIFVEVLGKRFQLNDRKISIIGKATKGRKVAPAAVSLNGEVDDDEDVEENPFYEEEDVTDDEEENGSDAEENEDEEVEEQQGGKEEVEEKEEDVEEDVDDYDYDEEMGSDIEDDAISDVEDYE